MVMAAQVDSQWYAMAQNVKVLEGGIVAYIYINCESQVVYNTVVRKRCYRILTNKIAMEIIAYKS